MPDRPDPETTDAYRPETPSPPAERFAPGALLAGRYRVVAPRGRGGMGEVYRADDLTLGQPVALKFLPEHLSHDPDRLARFRREVAAARKVSHPNVCRVYDITDHEGQSFLTMEFVDGEDLSSVLKRLGRVPEEKGVEIARQLCSALAAVHDEGLLHRDLKPANVMLDGRGKVRLTDFGLAAAAEDLSATEIRSGTPLYQAPEQIAGKEVTVRSDLYALGVVLYELFTGRRAFPDAKRDALPSKPSSHVTNLNPAVERIILKCLEPDPANRPRSANEVLAALPGGDPLAAAVAAGETPSPQAVANAAVTGTLRPDLALALLAFVVVGIAGVDYLNGKTSLVRQMPLDKSPRELARDARTALRKLNLAVPDGDAAHGFVEDLPAYLRELDRDPLPSWGDLRTGEPPLCYFWYRESPTPLFPSYPVRQRAGATWQVRMIDPAVEVPGEVCALFDLTGRLIELHAVPPRDPPTEPAGPPDWIPLLTAAGLDPAALKPDPTPRRTPYAFADARAAWTGTYPERPDRPVRVEAALRGGRPVYFYIGPEDVTDRYDTARVDPYAGSALAVLVVATLIAALMLTGTFWLVRRNLRQGRADLRGAGRFAAAVVVIYLLLWAVTARHVTRLDVEIFGGLALVVGRGVIAGALVGVAYLALEPGVRRRWPWLLVGWSRLLDGQWRNPLVGRDLLIGAAAGVAMGLLTQVQCLATGAFGQPVLLTTFDISAFYGGGPWVVRGLLLVNLSFLYFYLLFALTALTRRQWLGAAVWFGLIFLFDLDSAERPWVEGPFKAAFVAVWLFVLMRFGLLAYLVAMSCWWFLLYPMLTFDTDAWYAASGAIPAAVTVALAALGCYTATGGNLFTGASDD